MYYLNKIVGWILSPLGLLFVGLGIAWVLRISGKRMNRNWPTFVANWMVGLALFLFWAMCCDVTTRLIGAPLERAWGIEGQPHGDINGLTEADAIVVLGGGMGAHPRCGAPEMFGAADRVWHGARLFKTGKAKLVTLSGSHVEASTVPLIKDLGVPRDALMYFPDARNTEEEARLIHHELTQRTSGTQPTILLVTSAWHMNRALMMFQRVGFNVIPAPTDFEMSYASEGPLRVSDFFPNPDALARNAHAVKEIVGWLGYRFLRPLPHSH